MVKSKFTVIGLCAEENREFLYHVAASDTKDAEKQCLQLAADDEGDSAVFRVMAIFSGHHDNLI